MAKNEKNLHGASWEVPIQKSFEERLSSQIFFSAGFKKTHFSLLICVTLLLRVTSHASDLLWNKIRSENIWFK